MKLRTKSFVFIVVSATIMTVLLTSVSVLVFRNFSLSSVREQGRMAAEMVRVIVTEEMAEGADAPHWWAHINRLQHIPGLLEAHIIRGDTVKSQYGPGQNDKQHLVESEKEVLATGIPAEEVIEGEQVLFQYTIPYIAHSGGAVNCMQCHQAEEGAVLGAVSLTMDLTGQRAAAVRAIVTVLILLVLFTIGLAYFLRRLLSPIIDTAEVLHTVVTNAEAGNFSSRLNIRSDDEIGDIAEQTNHLMVTLEQSIGSISREVRSLTSDKTVVGGNDLLKRTVNVVHNMVEAARFKQMVESDRNLDEVYERLRQVLLTRFDLSRFSLYEVSNSNNRLKFIFAEGLPEGSELWCEPEVLIDADSCRAKRTAQTVSSLEESGICTSYCGNKIQESRDLVHVCLPMILSGSVGGVLQVIFTTREAKKTEAKLSTIKTFLDEITPVIETKRLMESLRESAMRDAMTGLYNRRFLEEYIETLIASVDRRKTSVGILMCDVDFFKQVNDSLGHEIGDSVLKGVAYILKHSVRSADIVIRYGGEEFLALLIDADEEKAMEIAERVRLSMEEHIFQTTSGPLSKTLSIGVSMYPTDTDAFWGCLKYSDVALYKAKESGRNKVLRFTSNMWEEEEKH